MLGCLSSGKPPDLEEQHVSATKTLTWLHLRIRWGARLLPWGLKWATLRTWD